MSMFPMTENPFADAKAWEKLAAGFVPSSRFAAGMDVRMNPAVGAVALSTLGLAFASQAFGTWMGVIAGAAETSQRMFGFDAVWGSLPAAGETAAPASRAQAAARTLIEDVRSTGRELADAAVKAVLPAPEIVPVLREAVPQAPGARAKPAMKAAPEAEAKPEAKVAPEAEAEPTPAVAEAKVKTELLPEDYRAPKSMDRPEAPDDLKAISGIGPKLEKVLNDLGVWTYSQIATLSREEIAWIDDYLAFKGRIERDGWIAQASKLAEAGTRSEA